MGFARLNALSKMFLGFYGGDDLESFPEPSLLPSNITTLTIFGFKNLKLMYCKGLQHLTSLADLGIFYCPELQCMPEEGLPSSISALDISGCPLLKER